MKKNLFKAVVVLFLAFTASACSDNKGAERLLVKQGYTHVETNGYSWFGCSKGDTYATKFKAVSPAGYEVSGVVCSGAGWGKSSTIRFDD